jgi:HlyD family secretion protein
MSGWRPVWWVWVPAMAGLVILAVLANVWWGRLDRIVAGFADATIHVVRPGVLEITLLEDGEIKPMKSVEFRSEIEGQTTLLYLVPESTRVKTGDLLAELASDELNEKLEMEEIQLRTTRSANEAALQELEITRNENASKLKKAEIDRDVADLDLRQYLEGEYLQKKLSAKIDIDQARREIERKQEEIEKNKVLLARDFVNRSKIEQLEFELQKAEDTLEKALTAERTLLDYDHPKNEKQKRSALDQATQEYEREQKRAESREAQAVAKVEEQKSNLAIREKRVTRLQDQLRKTKVRATLDGIVRYPDSEGNWRSGGEMLTVGQKVFEGQVLVVIPNTSQMIVSTRIHEADRHQVHEAMRVEVRVPAVPGHVFSGSVSKIAKYADSANRWLNPQLKEHATEILLDESDAALSPGDSAEVKVFIDRLEDVLAVPVQCIYARGQRSFVFVQRGRDAAPVEVKLGRSGGTMIQVAEGLASGDRVLMHADERLVAMIPPAQAPPEADAATAGSQRPGQPGGAREGRPSGGRQRAAKTTSPAETSAAGEVAGATEAAQAVTEAEASTE